MLRITKDAILFVSLENGVERTFDIMKTTNGLVSYLHEFVEIVDGVTVGTFLNIFSETPDICDYIFDDSLGGQELENYINELSKPLDIPVGTNNLKYVEIVHNVTHEEDDVIMEIKYFRAVGLNTENQLQPYSVELLPIAYYKDLPLVLNYDYKIVKIAPADGIRIEQVEVSGSKGFILYEVIHALFYEISFYGSPENREAMLTQIFEAYEEMEGEEPQALAPAANESKKLELERLERALSESLDSEDYESSAKIRDRIKLLRGE